MTDYQITTNDASTDDLIYLDGDTGEEMEIGLTEEKEQEIREIGETQVKKLDALRDHMIEYIAGSDLSMGEKRAWKEDYGRITKHLFDMKEAIDSDDIGGISLFSDSPPLRNLILDPDEMDNVNGIFNRWK